MQVLCSSAVGATICFRFGPPNQRWTKRCPWLLGDSRNVQKSNHMGSDDPFKGIYLKYRDEDLLYLIFMNVSETKYNISPQVPFVIYFVWRDVLSMFLNRVNHSLLWLAKKWCSKSSDCRKYHLSIANILLPWSSSSD